MDIERLARDLRPVFDQIPPASIAGVEVHVFGSCLQGDRSPGDIDLAVIYQDGATPTVVREAFDRTAVWPPPDLVFFTRNEERHFDFLRRSGAVPLFHFFPNTSCESMVGRVGARAGMLRLTQPPGREVVVGDSPKSFTDAYSDAAKAAWAQERDSK